MPGWNQSLFLILNAPAHPQGWLAWAAVLLATSPPVAGAAVLAVLWIWGPAARRSALLAVAGAVLVGQCANMFLGFLVFEPRPFMIPLGHTLMPHAADNSFPSDHATFVWTLGAGLLLTAAAPLWGAAVCLYGAAVAWSRVYLGVHFPVDMAASALVALVCAGIARAATPIASAWVAPFAERSYRAMLHLLRLPPMLFPRDPGQ